MVDYSKYEWIPKEYPGIWGDLTKIDKECFKSSVIPMLEHVKITADDKVAVFGALYAFKAGLTRGEDKAKRKYREEF